MGLIRFIKNQTRIHQAGKAGKIETEIQKYNEKPIKTDEDWKQLSKLNAKKAKIDESNKIKSEQNTTTKLTNNSIAVNYKGSQQVNSNQDNRQSTETSSKSRKK